jgi:glutamine amidotransferase
MIEIIDYKSSNLHSVANAIDFLGYKYKTSSRPKSNQKISHIILPGVGSFRAAIIQLKQLNFLEYLQDAADREIPILGICLGMQLLASKGFEHGCSDGLDLIPGQIKKIEYNGFRLPHMGWNNIEWSNPKHPILAGIKRHHDFYFVHSFEYYLDRNNHLLGTTHHGKPLVSAVAYKNIIGFQFHPEKSQDTGLALLENFCSWNGQC